jgi:hypothetical protein
MLNYETWQVLTESFQGVTTLGLSRPQTIGGPIGAHYYEDFGDDDEDDDDDTGFGDDDEDDDGEDEDYDGEQTDGGTRKKGDLIGSTDPEDGPDKMWPPDSEGDDDNVGTPDQLSAGADDFGDDEMGDDFLASVGAGAGGEEPVGGPEGGSEFGQEFGGEGMGGVDDDMLASLSGLGGEEDSMGGGLDDLGGMGGDFGGDMGGLDDLGGMGGDFGGDMGDDMGGLDDLGGMGGDDLEGGLDALPGAEPVHSLDDLGGMGGEEGGDFGGEEGGMGGEPCPDCNPDGTEQEGDPHCPTCAGQGFLDDGLGGEDFGGHEDFGGGEDFGGHEDFGGEEEDPTIDQMTAHMANYMQKYMRKHMKKESVLYREEFDLNPNWDQGAGQGQQNGPMQQQPMQPQMPMQQGPQAGQSMQQMKKRMVSFMSKKGMKKFMAADAPRSYMRKDERQNCKCEDNEFFDSLCDQARGNVHKKKTVREDALFIPPEAANYSYDEPQAGHAGFAPQSRVGSIGGGYTKADFADIPVLGESTRRYPTLNEYAAWKARKQVKRRR